MRKFKFFVIAIIIFNFYFSIHSFAFSEKTQNTILVTGFEPFMGGKTNGSWEAVKNLQGKKFNHKTIIVAQLPVVWNEASKKLQHLIQKYHPLAVIAFGQAGEEPVRIELIARNVTQKIPDNQGALPSQPFILKSAPSTIETTLNVKAIKQQLDQAGIPVTESTDAGAYLCNNVFFILMTDPGSKQALKMPRGFIHVPPLNASVKTDTGQSVLFDAKTLERTANIIVSEVAKEL